MTAHRKPTRPDRKLDESHLLELPLELGYPPRSRPEPSEPEETPEPRRVIVIDLDATPDDADE